MFLRNSGTYRGKFVPYHKRVPVTLSSLYLSLYYPDVTHVVNFWESVNTGLDYRTTGLTIITNTSGMSTGRDWTSDLRTLRNQGSAADEVDAIGEQQLRQTQSGSSS